MQKRLGKIVNKKLIKPEDRSIVPAMLDASSSNPRVLVVDDEDVIRDILCEFLSLEDFIVRGVSNGDAAITELRMRPYDVVITDLKMPGVSGVELLQMIGDEGIDVVTIMMTGFGTVETALNAMKKGAFDYILKPFKVEEVIRTLRRGLSQRSLRRENIQLKESLTLYKVSEAMATSFDIEHVLDVILRATLDESDADAATLHLQQQSTGEYLERFKLYNHDNTTAPDLPSPDHPSLLNAFEKGDHVIAHGLSANQYFRESITRSDLASYVALPLQVAGRVIGMLNVFSFTAGKQFGEGARKMLSVLASRAASAIDNARLFDDLVTQNTELENAKNRLEDNYQQTVIGFAQALEESDLYTRGHSERVSIYAGLTAEALQLPPEEVRRVVQAGLMHDIGKIGIRYDMLNKPGPLTSQETLIFREHPVKGKRILEPIPCMRNLIDAAWCHHEFFDGSGYPRGLAGHDIPLIGRIVQVADAYDAMTSDRAYRKALPHEVAVAELTRCSGTQFDPELVELFLRVITAYHRSDFSFGGEITLAFLEKMGQTNAGTLP